MPVEETGNLLILMARDRARWKATPTSPLFTGRSWSNGPTISRPKDSIRRTSFARMISPATSRTT